MYTLADWMWCRCWVPLLGAIAGDRGGDKLADWMWCRCWLALLGAIAGVGVHVGGLDVVPLLAAIAGDRGGVGVQVGGLDVVTLLGAIAGLPLLADWTWCRCWVPLLGCHWWG